jgi:hypothetical protein
MKTLTLVIMSLLAFNSFAQIPTYGIEISKLYSLVDKEINKVTPSTRLRTEIEGEWYKTHFQAQVFPGGCSDQDGYYTNWVEIKLNFDSPLKEVFRFTQRRDGVTYLNYPQFNTAAGGYGGYPVEFEGNTVKTIEGNCILVNFGQIKDVLMCTPYRDFSMCSWYSFFRKN